MNELILAALALYAVCVLCLAIFQRRFIYLRRNHPYEAPPPPLREQHSISADGNRLISWVTPPTTRPLTIVFFHGNGDYLKKSATYAKPYIDAGYGYMVCEYRGYSGLEGSPTEQGLYADARAQIRALIMSGTPLNRMVFYGHSLGTGVATQMALEFAPLGLMLLAPFQSVAKMAQIRFPYFPANWVTRDRFESDLKINKVTCPVLIGHGTRDQIVPYREGLALFKLAKEPKEFITVEGGGHADEISWPSAKVAIDLLEGKDRARVFDGVFLERALEWLENRVK